MNTLIELIIALVLAATPWIELLVVIPLGLAWGLSPVPLAIVVFVGNTASLLPLIWLHERWHRWRRTRFFRKHREMRRRCQVMGASVLAEEQSNDVYAGNASAEEFKPRTRRGERARRLWQRYGLPGVALLAPLVTGVHLAAAIALLAGATRSAVLAWFTASIFIWTAGLTIVTALGIEGIRWLWS